MLRTAWATIHRDRAWLAIVLLGGTLTLTLIGYPLVAGLLMISLDNSQRGYPLPLPRWDDWATRYLLGLLTLVIDFVYWLALPLLLLVVLFCLGTVLAAAAPAALGVVAGAVGVLVLLGWLGVFLGSVAQAARLRYVASGDLAQALSGTVLQHAAERPRRSAYWQARLSSLPLYGPVLLAAGLGLWLAGQTFVGAPLLLVLVVWLGACGWCYAQLVSVQLYVQAEQRATSRRPSPYI
jgi:hypothetical protein